MRVFKKVDGTKIDILKHVEKIYKEYPHVEVFVGTDSQNHKRATKYAVVVAFRINHGDERTPIYKGVHYVYYTDKIKPKIKDHLTRLVKETEYTIDACMELRARFPHLDITVELDYSPDRVKDKFLSAKVEKGMSGWASGVGFKVNIKPEAHAATKPADRHARY